MAQVTITKVKTSEEHKWNLMINGCVVGHSRAIYERKMKRNAHGDRVPTDAKGSQRTWFGKISVPLADGTLFKAEHLCGTKTIIDDKLCYKRAKQDSIVYVIKHFEEQLEGKDLGELKAPPKESAIKRQHNTVLTQTMITDESALEISKEQGYPVKKEDGSERTGAEQAVYLREQLEADTEANAKFPMGDLLKKVTQGTARSSSYADHYPDK